MPERNLEMLSLSEKSIEFGTTHGYKHPSAGRFSNVILIDRMDAKLRGTCDCVDKSCW
jgi:hypothetical protein